MIHFLPLVYCFSICNLLFLLFYFFASSLTSSSSNLAFIFAVFYFYIKNYFKFIPIT